MGAEFVVEEGDLAGLILSLDEGEEWVIGRDPAQCDLLLEDPEIDRTQLKCRRVDHNHFLENLSTTRPVMVNGVLLASPHLLADGDDIAVGRTRLIYFSDGPEPGGFSFEEDNLPLFSPTAAETSIWEAFSLPEQAWLFPEEISLASLEEPSQEQPFRASAEDVQEEHKDLLDEQQPQSIEQQVEAQPEEEETGRHQELPAEEEADYAEALSMPPLIHEEAFHLDLTPSTRFILKVIAGPNTGAEFAIDLDREYLLGTDTTTCDIIFHDLSVSREHARLTVHADGSLAIEDLSSRNGVIVDQKRIEKQTPLDSHSVVTLGTSSFLLIDKEAPQETMVTPVLEPVQEEVVKKETTPPPLLTVGRTLEERRRWLPVDLGPLSGVCVFGLMMLGLILLVGYGVITLSHTREAVPRVKERDWAAQLQEALKGFPAVRYTFNRTTGQLFLVGHVSSSIEMSELLYQLQSLTFLRGVQNNVVNDEAIWQEMNLLLAKYPEFKGVSMHSPMPGHFVLSGYLKTETQASDLNDYVNLNFNYLNLLENRVVVEQDVSDEVSSRLFQGGFGAVMSLFSNGDLTLTGYVGSNQAREFQAVVAALQQIPGVRHVQNYVVTVAPEQQVIDLSLRYPDRYVVTGYSKHGDININVVINGKILMRGDTVDSMTITSIQPHAIFLEKDGLKYKIEYNK